MMYGLINLAEDKRLEKDKGKYLSETDLVIRKDVKFDKLISLQTDTKKGTGALSNRGLRSAILFELFSDLMGPDMMAEMEDQIELPREELLGSMYLLLTRNHRWYKELEESAQLLANQEVKPIGRPSLSLELIEAIQYYREKKKMSYREISDKTGVSLGSIFKYCNKEEQVT